MDKILVTTYPNPDLDGVAGAYAYAEYLAKKGESVELAIIGTFDEETRYVLNTFTIPQLKTIENTDEYKKVILIDVSEIQALKGKINPDSVIEIIDHRKFHTAEKFINSKAQIELVGSVATLIAEKFIQDGIEPSKESAVLLCGAIISNTLNFKGAVTTDRDIYAFQFLNKMAKLSDTFWKNLFLSKSNFDGEKVIKEIKNNSAYFEIGGKKVIINQIEMIGAEKLIMENEQDIIKALEEVKSENNLDIIFQSIVDLEHDRTFLITNDQQTKVILEKIFNTNFNVNILEIPKLILRKEIMPLLKNML